MKSMIVFIFFALFFPLMPLQVHANEDELRGLMAEASDFQAEYAKAIRTQGQIEAAEQNISGSELALRTAVAPLQNRRDPQKQPPALCPQQPVDPRAAAACEAEAAKLNAWRAELGSSDDRSKYAEKLQQEQERLNQMKMRWADKKKSNRALIDVLDIAFQSWQRRYTALVFQSSPYNRLVSTKEGSVQCKNPAAPGKDATLEAAQSCLQWLWVSAKQNS